MALTVTERLRSVGICPAFSRSASLCWSGSARPPSTAPSAEMIEPHSLMCWIARSRTLTNLVRRLVDEAIERLSSISRCSLKAVVARPEGRRLLLGLLERLHVVVAKNDAAGARRFRSSANPPGRDRASGSGRRGCAQATLPTAAVLPTTRRQVEPPRPGARAARDRANRSTPWCRSRALSTPPAPGWSRSPTSRRRNRMRSRLRDQLLVVGPGELGDRAELLHLRLPTRRAERPCARSSRPPPASR